MSNKFLRYSIIMLLSLIVAPVVQAADAPVKREMRASWVATVWRLDWPPSVITSTGNTTQINKQKAAMTTLLDSLQINNFNAVNFQVRSRSDAMYKSSYEPWSTDLVSERGMDPGWDPLEWVVAECHKRGMECHAWLNPYRYESSVSGAPWNGANDYRTTHPEWIMEYNNMSILNPGLPEVRQRICDIIKEILTNYDVDGILFDDYFYINGTPLSVDTDLYNEYKSNGGTMSQADWRRDNVNQMVADVYSTIQKVKPWARFGISPAGVACTKGTVANKYGVTPCPSGSDWQYDGLYSDPLAWISSHNIDFISPQVYWTIGSSPDYSKVTPWWGTVAEKFGRHLYVSHSISSLTSSSKAPGLSATEQNKVIAKSSGPNDDTFEEYADEVRLNRSSSLDGNPGSMFYSTKYLYSVAPKFGHYLKQTVFNNAALVPAMMWKAGNNPGLAKNVSRAGDKLSWEGYENVRYTVYAIPTSVPMENFHWDVDYLLGTSYETEYTIPSNRLSGYNYAVCVYDRYGYEYSPAFVGVATETLDAPELIYPAANTTVEYPFEFSWKAVEKATSYIIEMAQDAKFDQNSLIYTVPCSTTSCSTTTMPDLSTGSTYYWRVRACGIAANDGISESRKLNLSRMEITSPANGATDVSLTPTIKWSIADRNVTVEMSTTEEFSQIRVSEEANGGQWKVPANYLSGYTTYYCRLAYEKSGESVTSPTVAFTTKEVVPAAISFSYPVDGGNFYADDYLEATPAAGYNQVIFQLDENASVNGRFVQETANVPTWHSRNTAGNMSKTLVKDKLYYMRLRGSYKTSEGTKYSEWSKVISAYYRGENSGVEEVEVDLNDSDCEWFNLQGIRIDRPSKGDVVIRRKGSKIEKVVVK